MTEQQARQSPKASSIEWKRLYTDKRFSNTQRFRLLFYFLCNSPEIDIYHFLFVPTLITSLFFSLIVRLRRLKTIQTIPCLYRQNLSSELASLLFFGDKLVTLSDWTEQKLYSLGLKNTFCINAGINTQMFKPPEDKSSVRKKFHFPDNKVVVLFSGELSRLGSLEIMLSVTRKVLKTNEKIHMVYASPTRKPKDKVARRRAYKFVCRHKLEKSVTFLGDVKDFSSLLKACDLLLFPVSSMMGKIDTPLTILEAMASELPVILTDIPPLNEMLRADAGVAIMGKDKKTFAQAVLELADDEERRYEMGKTGREIIESHYSLDKMVKAYEDIYDEFA
jgi:glycosyltransferase involved in cell wall biosynthesis